MSARLTVTQVIYCYAYVLGVHSPAWQLTDDPCGQAVEGSLSLYQLALTSFQGARFSPAPQREPGHLAVLDSYSQGTQKGEQCKTHIPFGTSPEKQRTM